MRNGRLKLVVLITALAVLGVVGVVAVFGSSPAVCAQCHQAQAKAMAGSDHGDTSCYACHVDRGAWGLVGQKGRELFVMYPLQLVGAEPSGPATVTSRAQCLSCHQDIMAGPTTGARLKIDHAACATGPTCDSCHSATPHTSAAVRYSGVPVMEQCVACHSANNAPITCLTCHLDDPQKQARVAGPWQKTHGANWRKTHGMGNLASCRTCHQAGYCKRCHGVDVPHPTEFGSTHGTLAIASPDQCETCHPDRRLCDGCHKIEMPHPDDFIRTHVDEASGRYDPSCLHCHVSTDCEDCHAFHVHPGGSQGVPVPWVLTNEDQRPASQK